MNQIDYKRIVRPTINQYASFDLRAWLSSSGRFNPVTIMAGPGSGKSRFIGRVLIWHDLVAGTPQVVIDPVGGSLVNVIDKCNRWAADFERRFWETFKQPLPGKWIRFVEYHRKMLADRIVYIDMNGQAAFPLYYRLSQDEHLFDMAQRFVEVVRRADPALETASIEGFNAIYKVGMYAGMILSALGLQITEAEDLIRHPEQWAQRFEQALSAYPEVRPAVRFFRAFVNVTPDRRARSADSFLTKILAFSADPTMAAMFGANDRSLDLQEVINKKQTVLLDFSKVHNAERRRMLLLWICSEVFLFGKSRGGAGRAAPLGVVIDEITQLLGYQQNNQSIMAADFEEWVSVIARNRGIWLTSALQTLSQVNRQMQGALLQGNLMIGAIPNPEDARTIAEYFFEYDPYWVKKEIPVWMGIASEPFYDPVEARTGAVRVWIDHISTRTTPTVIDYTTEEFSIDEQLQLLTQAIQQLPRFQFLVRASGIEGQLAAPLRTLDISGVDTGVYPDEERVAEACRRLIARSRFSKERILAEIKQRASKPVHKKRSKPAKEPARLNTSSSPPYVTADTGTPDTGVPLQPVPLPAGEANGDHEDPWQP